MCGYVLLFIYVIHYINFYIMTNLVFLIIGIIIGLILDYKKISSYQDRAEKAFKETVSKIKRNKISVISFK